MFSFQCKLSIIWGQRRVLKSNHKSWVQDTTLFKLTLNLILNPCQEPSKLYRHKTKTKCLTLFYCLRSLVRQDDYAKLVKVTVGVITQYNSSSVSRFPCKSERRSKIIGSLRCYNCDRNEIIKKAIG